jgi:signal peptidase I
VLVLLALVLALTLKTYVAEAYEIKGCSMVPTFSNGERVVVLKLFYEIMRGDIVIFSSTEDPTKDLIKRVIGLPGERVRISKGRVYVNEEPLDEDYLDDARRSHYEETPERRLGPDEYYVLGDNRDDSQDSRRFGPIGGSRIKGKVIVRWWPFREVRAF